MAKIISQTEKKGVKVYVVEKICDDALVEQKLGKFCTPREAKFIIDHNADVYTTEGKLLLRFRKNVLPQKNVDQFYENVIAFAKQKTSTRGTTSGSEIKDPSFNPPIMSNILGYFDKWTIGQKHIFKTLGIPPPFKVRVSSFTSTYPDKWQAALPLIQDIDKMYKKLNPVQHKKQLAMAEETAYRVPGTSFTTITTNVNFQTAFHTDSGDYRDGFGNLVVIEKGAKYKGGYTVFPQYGIGVDVRTGDFLAMDVHQVHGNTKIRPLGKDAIRMSIVCYLREEVYNKSKGTTERHVQRNVSTMNKLKQKYMELKAEAKEDVNDD